MVPRLLLQLLGTHCQCGFTRRVLVCLCILLLVHGRAGKHPEVRAVLRQVTCSFLLLLLCTELISAGQVSVCHLQGFQI